MTENTLHLHDKTHPVNTAQCNERCLWQESRESRRISSLSEKCEYLFNLLQPTRHVIHQQFNI